MFERKITKNIKTVVKNLRIEEGHIVDLDGEVRDLNKIALTTFCEGNEFDFTIVSKSDESEVLEESGEE